MIRIFCLVSVCCALLWTPLLYSQNLMKERIRLIHGSKKSVYWERGVFHNGNQKVNSVLKKIRHSYKKSKKTERVVFDFGTDLIPKVYGHFAGNELILSIDIQDTRLSKTVGSFGKSQFVKKIDFYPLENNSLSIEMRFNSKVVSDIFYLNKPGRLVVDLKKM